LSFFSSVLSVSDAIHKEDTLRERPAIQQERDVNQIKQAVCRLTQVDEQVIRR